MVLGHESAFSPGYQLLEQQGKLSFPTNTSVSSTGFQEVHNRTWVQWQRFIQSRLQVPHQRHGIHMAYFVHITEYWITPWDRTRKCRLLSCSSYIMCTNIFHIVKPIVSAVLHVMIWSKPYRLPSCLRNPFPGHHVANTSFLAWTLLLRLCFPQLWGPNLSVSPSFCFISISLPLLFCLNRKINPESNV